MCRVEDGDHWTMSTQTRPVARKPHQCVECWRTIPPGERYHHLRGLLGDQWSDLKWCEHCDAAGEWLSIQCRGYLVGQMLEELVEHWQEDTAFRSVWLARAIAGMRRRWLDGRMPVMGEPPALAVSA